MTDLPKEHQDAIGIAYYTALGTPSDWDKVSITGTLLSLLMTSAKQAGDVKDQKAIEFEQIEQGKALREYQREEARLHAFWMCQCILGRIGELAYKYGKVQSGGFKLIPAQGAK